MYSPSALQETLKDGALLTLFGRAPQNESLQGFASSKPAYTHMRGVNQIQLYFLCQVLNIRYSIPGRRSSQGKLREFFYFPSRSPFFLYMISKGAKRWRFTHPQSLPSLPPLMVSAKKGLVTPWLIPADSSFSKHSDSAPC